MRGMRGIELKTNNKNRNLPTGLIYSFSTDLTPGSSNYVITLPSNTSSFTKATFVLSITPNNLTGVQDILNNFATTSNFGEIPRLTIEASNTAFYFINSYSYDGLASISAQACQIGTKNTIVATIDDLTLGLYVNGQRGNDQFTSGNLTAKNWNRQYRLSGLPSNNINLFNGTYHFFGIWNRVLTNTEIDIINNWKY
jgi:hypothetical protein